MTDAQEKLVWSGAGGIPGGEVSDPKMREVFVHLGALTGAEVSSGYGNVESTPGGGNFYAFSETGVRSLLEVADREDLALPAELTASDSEDGSSPFGRAVSELTTLAQFFSEDAKHAR